MPVEIKELVIRAVADEPIVREATEEVEDTRVARKLADDGLIEECVQQVVKILQRGRER